MAHIPETSGGDRAGSSNFSTPVVFFCLVDLSRWFALPPCGGSLGLTAECFSFRPSAGVSCSGPINRSAVCAVRPSSPENKYPIGENLKGKVLTSTSSLLLAFPLPGPPEFKTCSRRWVPFPSACSFSTPAQPPSTYVHTISWDQSTYNLFNSKKNLGGESMAEKWYYCC